MQRPIRILHVFGRMHRGGAEMRTLEVMRHLDRARFHLHFCVLSGQEGALDGEICALGGQVHPCALGYSFPARFRRLLRAGQYDVVHSHVHTFSGFILRLAAQEKIAMRIAHFRSTNDEYQASWRRQLQRAVMLHWINRHATHILAVCEGAMAATWGARWARDTRCQVIYNGFELAAFTGLPARAEVRAEFDLPAACPLYLHVGRLEKPKNHLRLLDLFAALHREEPAARLLLVGRGGNAIEAAVRARIAQLGLSDAIVLTGERRDVPRLLRAADLLLLPSLWEGLPGVVLEACAAGTPVLASDLPGVREIAGYFPTVSALSLEQPDAEWAARVREIATHCDDEDREAVRAAFAHSPFTIERCTDAHCAVWTGATGGHA